MAFSLSSFASPTIFTLSSPPSSPAKSLKTTPFLISTKNPNRNLPGRAKNLPPLRVAAPASPPPQTADPEGQREPDGEDYGAEDEIEDATSTSKFNWRDHWYPVSLIEDLDPRLPTPFQLLGRDLVIWYDGESWVAFDDRCPHRLAPLSVSFLVVFGCWDFGGKTLQSHDWSLGLL